MWSKFVWKKSKLGDPDGSTAQNDPPHAQKQTLQLGASEVNAQPARDERETRMKSRWKMYGKLNPPLLPPQSRPQTPEAH